MATIKAYSVSETGGSQSSVYSLSPTGADGGGSQAYLHSTAAGLTEGRTKTLLAGDRTVPSPAKSDVASIKSSGLVVGTAARGITSATKVVATTTTTKGSGAGLIVSFTTQSDGKAASANTSYTIEEGGEGYANDDEVSIDGFPGSKLLIVKTA